MIAAFCVNFEAPRLPTSNLTPNDPPTNAILNIDKNQVRRQRDRERRKSMSTEQRDEINARRRAADKKKKEDQKKNLTTEQLEDMYARKSQKRREQYRKYSEELTHDQREERSAQRRSLRNSRTPEEEQRYLSMRKASYNTKRLTPCAASIALPRPDVSTTTIANPAMSTSSLTSPGMPNSVNETDGN